MCTGDSHPSYFSHPVSSSIQGPAISLIFPLPNPHPTNPPSALRPPSSPSAFDHHRAPVYHCLRYPRGTHIPSIAQTLSSALGCEPFRSLRQVLWRGEHNPSNDPANPSPTTLFLPPFELSLSVEDEFRSSLRRLLRPCRPARRSIKGLPASPRPANRQVNRNAVPARGAKGCARCPAPLHTADAFPIRSIHVWSRSQRRKQAQGASGIQ